MKFLSISDSVVIINQMNIDRKLKIQHRLNIGVNFVSY